VLLLDEPLAALDDETKAEMYTLLRSVQRLTGVTTLHVTHSLAEAKALADRILLLTGGAVVERPRET
jgi:ABC-type nitrate/sulfonate/bicarbonate transport system ATPase subunit